MVDESRKSQYVYNVGQLNHNHDNECHSFYRYRGLCRFIKRTNTDTQLTVVYNGRQKVVTSSIMGFYTFLGWCFVYTEKCMLNHLASRTTTSPVKSDHPIFLDLKLFSQSVWFREDSVLVFRSDSWGTPTVRQSLYFYPWVLLGETRSLLLTQIRSHKSNTVVSKL